MVEGQAVILVLGGTRSGKSAVAERLAADAGLPVTYVAAGPCDDGSDPEWSSRVAAHRARRPPSWRTVEVRAGGDLDAVLRGVRGTALADSLGTWLAGWERFEAPAGRLCDALAARQAAGLPTVLVSEEVGLGVHPETAAGRRFADALGELNQRVAAMAGQVLLVVAGRALELGPPVTTASGGPERPSGRVGAADLGQVGQVGSVGSVGPCGPCGPCGP